MAARALERLETLLTGIYDLDTDVASKTFSSLTASRCPANAARRRATSSSSCNATDDELCMSLYLDPAVLERLESPRPERRPRCSAISPTAGPRSKASAISSASPTTRATTGRCRGSTLEMQAEIDKYVASFALLRRAATRAVFRRNFTRSSSARARIDPTLAAGRESLYRRASR